MSLVQGDLGTMHGRVDSLGWDVRALREDISTLESNMTSQLGSMDRSQLSNITQMYNFVILIVSGGSVVYPAGTDRGLGIPRSNICSSIDSVVLGSTIPVSNVSYIKDVVSVPTLFRSAPSEVGSQDSGCYRESTRSICWQTVISLQYGWFACGPMLDADVDHCIWATAAKFDYLDLYSFFY